MSEIVATLIEALASGFLLFAAGLFANAVWHKIRTFTEFSAFVSAYRLLPEFAVQPMAAMIVAVELVSIPGALRLVPELALLPMLLMLLYTVAMGINLLRGRSDIDCGCGGTPMPISVAAVVRNLLLAGAFGWAASTGVAPFELIAQDLPLMVVVLAFVLCLGLLYAVFNQLEANQAIRRRLLR